MNVKQKGGVRAFVASVFLASGASGQDVAEENNTASQTIEEIVVTGQAVQDLDLDSLNSTGSRLGLTSFETPASIDIIDSGTMTVRGFKTVTEAAESLPGVLSGEAPGEPSSFSMRGFQQNQITELRDGLRAGPHNMTMRPQNTFNLERVEILKGPSSVLYGEGAVAGTINMVTKKPVLGQETKIETLLSYGRYDSWEVGFGVGGPLADNAAYRLDIDNAQSDGWVDRADSRSTNITGAILWAVTDSLDLMVSGDFLDDDLPSYWGTPFVTESFAGSNAMSHVIASTYNKAIDSRMRFISYNVSDHVSESNHFWGRLLADWRISENVTLRNQFYDFTADRRWINSEQYLFNPTTELIDRDRFFVLHDQDLYGDRLDLTVDHHLGSMENTAVLGINYSDLDFVRSRGFPDGDSVDPLDPVPGVFGPLDRRVSPTKMETVAVFFEDNLKITEALSFVAGLRYDSIDLVRENFNVDGSFDPASSFTDSYEPFSWRIGTVYQFTPRLVLYGQYSVAQDPPSSSSLFLVNTGQNFDLSQADQWELGLKTQLENATGGKPTEITLAIYDIKRDDILTQISQTEVSNIGSQSSRGAEFSIATDATDRWRIGGNASYIDSEYDLFVDPDFGIDATGNRPPNVPRWAANLWSSVSEVGGLPLELGGGARYISDRFADSGNTVKLLSYTLVDAFAAYTFDNSRVMIRVRNLTDEEYSPWADVFYPNQIVLGSPRTYEVSVYTTF
jgi:iron complex outermembrane receptor protein